ncbi:MAG TPA: tRNA (adenosine(37)-N6)-threonylcarbamoyltransferase complex dimerization subunit type 1 TsaB [Candidatus Acidoferrales bacterium]|nr:tRNA (adenosine(37)-N6)-threonylcarbamoyltransferase complex dimerization subunit type 1 TsaB [Candidatus Acidoferrales bacterium]
MLLLAVDTATPAGSLAVLSDGQLAGVISTALDEPYSSRLFRQLEILLSELQLQTQNFDLFAVAAGPGSFTGLRVGLTAVKAWAEVFSKPVIAISGLEAIAAQAQPHSENGLIAPVLDARRGQIYAALFRRAAQLVQEEPDQVCTIEEFLAQLAQRKQNEEIVFVSPAPAILRGLLTKRDGNRLSASISDVAQSASPLLAPIIGKLALERAARGEFTDALHLDANYIRRSDAELLWKKQ